MPIWDLKDNFELTKKKKEGKSATQVESVHIPCDGKEWNDRNEERVKAKQESGGCGAG